MGLELSPLRGKVSHATSFEERLTMLKQLKAFAKNYTVLLVMIPSVIAVHVENPKRINKKLQITQRFAKHVSKNSFPVGC
ncbi:Hypothetical predicted protein [Octopus vulgaris]|uniref:Uncharacterized protein n=1 Tax=Octopus vulgaris TaxID=6645 RepID=A0AA36AXW3_OCTVU|nr:Hypothetical predicted protein [Octopus vulgaris]